MRDQRRVILSAFRIQRACVGWVTWKLLVLVCLGLAALSLLGPSVPTYDPWAWIIWGRQIAHLDLNTCSGPSWKPRPVFFPTVFSFAGDDAAPTLWLLISRAGGMIAIAM